MNDFRKLHKNVQAAISGLEIEYRIRDHSKFRPETKNPRDFAAALGYSIEQISKTLFLRSRDAMPAALRRNG